MSVTENPFVVGDAVEVWSNSRKVWFLGKVEDIAPRGGVGSVAEGCVKVRFGRKLEKWILPKDFGRVLRRHVPRVYIADPQVPPVKMLQMVRSKWYRNGVNMNHTFSDSLFGNGGGNSVDVLLTVSEIVDLWSSALAEESGYTSTDAELTHIRKCVTAMFASIQRPVSSKITVDEFMHQAFLLKYPPGRSVLVAMADELHKRRPAAMPQAVAMWVQMDKECDGRIHVQDLEEALRQAGIRARDVEDEAKTIIHDMDGDNIASVCYCDFVSKFLKLNCVEVCLSWYDITNGWSKYISPLVLWHQEGGIWHTGMVVFGREFYYSGRIFRGRPGATPYGLPTKIQRLGLTQRNAKEFETYIIRELDRQFTEENYDFLEHNCNHFTDKAAQFLLGQQIPEEIRKQPERAMNAPLPMMFRPWVNQWLGRIEGDQPVASNDVAASARAVGPMDSAQALFGDKNMVLYTPHGQTNAIAAQVTKRNPDGSCDVCWHDGSKLCKESAVPASHLKEATPEDQNPSCTIS